MGNLLTFRLLAAARPVDGFVSGMSSSGSNSLSLFGLLAFCTINRVLQQQLKYPKLKRLWDGLHQFDNFLNFLLSAASMRLMTCHKTLMLVNGTTGSFASLICWQKIS